MKSGMKVQLNEFGETQVIGEIKDNKFTEIWGIGYHGGHIMKPSGKLLKDILSACTKKDAESSYQQAAQSYLDHKERLACIRFMQERINKDQLCELDT